MHEFFLLLAAQTGQLDAVKVDESKTNSCEARQIEALKAITDKDAESLQAGWNCLNGGSCWYPWMTAREV